MAFVGGLMPVERPQHLRYTSRSAHTSPLGSPAASPAGSRRSSVSSTTSAQTDPGPDLLERLRQSSLSSTQTRVSQKSQGSGQSVSSSKSGFKSLFGRSQKDKHKEGHSKTVLTSRHAAAVKTKLMMQQHQQNGRPVIKTAGVVGTQGSGHLSAAAQEARHPHSGPPTIHRSHTAVDMPALTRIVSGDERDEEDEISRNLRLRSEWEVSKQPAVSRVVEHESDESTQTSATPSVDEGEPGLDACSSEPSVEHLKPSSARRPGPVTRNSCGSRFHRDEKGLWRR